MPLTVLMRSLARASPARVAPGLAYAVATKLQQVEGVAAPLVFSSPGMQPRQNRACRPAGMASARPASCGPKQYYQTQMGNCARLAALAGCPGRRALLRRRTVEQIYQEK